VRFSRWSHKLQHLSLQDEALRRRPSIVWACSRCHACLWMKECASNRTTLLLFHAKEFLLQTCMLFSLFAGYLYGKSKYLILQRLGDCNFWSSRIWLNKRNSCNYGGSHIFQRLAHYIWLQCRKVSKWHMIWWCISFLYSSGLLTLQISPKSQTFAGHFYHGMSKNDTFR